MEVFHEPPDSSSFRPLADFESQTPSSFYSGPTVLHYTSPGSRLVASGADLQASAALSKIADQAAPQQQAQNGHGGQQALGELITLSVDIWVTSEKLMLFRPERSVGVSIPYPNISVHAIQRLQDPSTQQECQALFLQVTASDGFDEDAADETLSLSLIPSTDQQTATGDRAGSDSPSIHASSQRTPVAVLFEAVSACSSLHPDPASPSSSVADPFEDPPTDGRDGALWQAAPADGLPPAMPGSGGWITAENVSEYFDGEGNWRGQGLGPGAGIVRQREEETADVNGHGADGEDGDAKWRRTD